MSFDTEQDAMAYALTFIPKLRALGVMQFSGFGINVALGPLPSDAPSAPDTRKQPQDALSAALELRGTRSEPETEHKGDAK
jgi:hypothetical protein